MACKVARQYIWRESRQSKNSSFDTKTALRVAKRTCCCRTTYLRFMSLILSTNPRRPSMSRQKLFAIVTTIAILAVTACTDMTGPSHDAPPPPCPVTGGSDCKTT
jgi:hypothetical protein